ncbi:putative uncharacterized protein [Clostridium sp. CAG:354]|nr:putative uncharacterized protein [Clostridium sp. CAG:354]
MPSPIYPTTLPLVFNKRIILAFWIGDNLANTLCFLFNNLITPLSGNLSISLPIIILCVFIPTFLQIQFVTSALSPVKTITLMPASFIRFIAIAADSLGGSKNPINPVRIILDSSLTSKLALPVTSFSQTAITLRPSLFKSVDIFLIFFFISGVILETSFL